MNKIILIMLIGLFTTPALNAQLNWVSLEEAGKIQEQHPEKLIFVNIYTDWCGYCKRMDKTTFANKEVIETLNKNFILVKFNAESKQAQKFRNKTYKYIKGDRGKGINSFAYFALRGKVSYPSSLIIGNPKIKEVLQGFLQPNELLTSLEPYIKKES